MCLLLQMPVLVPTQTPNSVLILGNPSRNTALFGYRKRQASRRRAVVSVVCTVPYYYYYFPLFSAMPPKVSAPQGLPFWDFACAVMLPISILCSSSAFLIQSAAPVNGADPRWLNMCPSPFGTCPFGTSAEPIHPFLFIYCCSSLRSV